jgi:hypothetical protein
MKSIKMRVYSPSSRVLAAHVRSYGDKLADLYVAGKKYSVHDKSKGHCAPPVKKHFWDHVVGAGDNADIAAKFEEMQDCPSQMLSVNRHNSQLVTCENRQNLSTQHACTHVIHMSQHDDFIESQKTVYAPASQTV